MKKQELENLNLRQVLTDELRELYNEILKDFNKILLEWKLKDGFNEIRVGYKLDKKILDFLIKFTDYMVKNYKNLDIKICSEILTTFPLKFYYGPYVDDFNYIYDDELGDIFLTKLNDFEKTVSLGKLNSISKRFKELRKELD